MEVVIHNGQKCVESVCTCGARFYARLRSVEAGQGRYCSRSCSARAGGYRSNEVKPQDGAANPNWKGGISQNTYRYKQIQRARYPERVAAREAVRLALKRGVLAKKPCEVCGENPSFAHHSDYSKPLDVQWLCRPHHVEHHVETGDWGRDMPNANPAPVGINGCGGRI